VVTDAVAMSDRVPLLFPDRGEWVSLDQAESGAPAARVEMVDLVFAYFGLT
jgi:hypothetical protein